MTVEYLEKNNLILFRAYRGSKAYGTFIEGKSDLDEVIIYMNPIEELLGLNYFNQVNEDNNDTVGFEIGKFIHLLQKANPTVCEALWTPEDCVIYKHPVMDQLISIRDSFLTKKMKHSFGGYAIQQIRKASGTQKKMNWEEQDVTRKTPLDFVFTPHKQGSQPITTWLAERGLKQEYCGLVAIPNMRYTYGLYYDYAQHCQFEKLDYKDYLKLYKILNEGFTWGAGSKEEYNEIVMDGQFKNSKYKGIIQDYETSNDISLSSTEKNAKPLVTVMFNKDGYQQHCKVYKEYTHWLTNHNKARFVDVNSHGQTGSKGKIDGKNMLHCVRLLRMSKEIATGQGLIMRRPDAEYLISIRHGEHDLDKLTQECEEILKENDNLFDNSSLPDDVDREFMSNLLIQIRKDYYGI